MKKINRVCLLILLMAVTLLFAGCEILEQPFPIGTEADSGSLIDPEKTSPETEAPLTPEEEALVDLAAEAALAEQLKAYGENHSGGYLSVDDEGWLCLVTEIIVELETHFWQQDGGCGVDHDHVFITERICKPE